jgi:putative SOS response-associated peptidase YedK
MCGRYATKRDKQKIAEAFHVGKVFDEPYAPNFNVAPSTFEPVIRVEKDSTEREMVLMRWGLVPFFAKSLTDWKGFSTINAKAETITSSATWRGPFKSRRRIVPADYFYEWKALDDSKKPRKQPYAISLKSGEPIAFAGLWDAWHDKGGNTWLQTFSIITTEANELMSQIHTRMPVILHQRDWARWLDRTPTDQLPIDLLRPYESDAMEMRACNPAVGNVRNNGPAMLVCPAPIPGIPLNSE